MNEYITKKDENKIRVSAIPVVFFCFSFTNRKSIINYYTFELLTMPKFLYTAKLFVQKQSECG